MRETLEEMHYEDHQAGKRARYDEDFSTQSTDTSNVEAYDAILGETGCDEFQHIMQQVNEPPGQLAGTQQPSSLQAFSPLPAQELVPPASQIPDVPHTTDRAHAKRNEVRRAHRYLQEHAEPGLLEIGPLPSSWPPEEEHDPESRPSPEAGAGTSAQQISSTKQGFLVLGDGACSPQPRLSQPGQDSQHTDTLTISISESALAPESFASHGETDAQDSEHDEMKTKRAAKDRLMARMRARTAAYLAAQESSYSAWANVSLVSAGDNHTEREEEL